MLTFFKTNFLQKILSGIPSEDEKDWIQIRSNILLGLIWVQSVCKGYEQMTLVGNELTLAFIMERHNCLMLRYDIMCC